jgi:hypothetical protein
VLTTNRELTQKKRKNVHLLFFFSLYFHFHADPLFAFTAPGPDSPKIAGIKKNGMILTPQW